MKISQQPHTRRRFLISENGSGTHQESEPPDDRPERSTPHHLPHGFTEEELAEFIEENQPEKTP